MPGLVVPAVVCRFLEEVEDHAVAVFRPFNEEVELAKEFLLLPYVCSELLLGLVVEGPSCWRGRRYESLESDMGLEVEEVCNLLVEPGDAVVGVERREGELVDNGGCVVVYH